MKIMYLFYAVLKSNFNFSIKISKVRQEKWKNSCKTLKIKRLLNLIAA